MRTLLVANRGEIARRILRTAGAMGIRTVAVYSPVDADAPHVAEADLAVPVSSYLAVEELVAAARRTGSDAVHPGYGFLSERAPAALAFAEADVTWVGPPPAVIAALGDKVKAKEMMGAAGVPLLGGEANRFPLLIKAAAGGGGRGMRLVQDAEELDEARIAASREAAAAFGDGTVFVERWLPDPRHIEVQIVADGHGHAIQLGDRECSIQRRHQKVIEEAPAPALEPDLRRRMAEAAVAGARAVGYVGAGTWEFLVDGDDFFFLEVNTRLQVEHPVTEAVAGVDLVRLQLEVADGRSLPTDQVALEGHAIEARVVAEDPTQGWLPSTGRLHRFVSGDPGIRADVGVRSGSVVPPDYDSLLGKLIAHAATRAEAAARLAAGLERLEVHGVRTNRELLIQILREPDFLAARTTTGYLERHPFTEPPAPDEHALAAALWAQARRRRHAELLPAVPASWRNLRSQPQRALFGGATVAYDAGRDGAVTAEVNGRRFDARVHGADDGGIDLEIEGVRERYQCEQAGASVWVGTATRQRTLTELPQLPEPDATAVAGRGPTAPVPGTIIAVHVAAGDQVTSGQTLVVLEAMKLEHRITADGDGIVESVSVAVGDRVDAHQLLVVMAGT